MGLFSNYYLYNRHVKAINPILLIDMSTSLLFYNNIKDRKNKSFKFILNILKYIKITPIFFKKFYFPISKISHVKTININL